MNKNPSRNDFESWILVQNFAFLLWAKCDVKFLKENENFEERLVNWLDKSTNTDTSYRVAQIYNGFVKAVW